MHKPHETVYAIMRIDTYPGVPEDQIRVEDQVTVKEVVWSQALAEREVARLNRINAEKGCRYFWRTTRLFSPGQSAGSSAG